MNGFILLACTASVVFSFLTLACAGRLVLEQRESITALIQGHNTVAGRVGDFDAKLDNALDCLLTIDALADTR